MQKYKPLYPYVFVKEVKDTQSRSGIIVAGVGTPKYEVIFAPNSASVQQGDIVYVDKYAEPEEMNGMLIYRESAILAREIK